MERTGFQSTVKVIFSLSSTKRGINVAESDSTTKSLLIMIILIAMALLLHPGHMTRIEIRASDDGKSIEIAMRIDAADLEAALKARVKKPVDLSKLSDDEAQKLVGEYLRATITANGEKLTEDQFAWVGWERKSKTPYAWIYFEMRIPSVQGQMLNLHVRTLFEVEPALKHVVVLAENIGNRTEILSAADQAISIR